MIGSSGDRRAVLSKLPIVGCVLAGGASTRMGRDKALLPWGGRTLVEHQVERLGDFTRRVAVIAKGSSKLPALPCEIVPDPFTEPAPLHGLHAALGRFAQPIFVLAVDLPLVPVALMRELAGRFLDSDLDAVVPSSEGIPQPLCAAYGPRALAVAEALVAAGDLAAHRLLERVRAEIWPEERWRPYALEVDPFRPLNTPEDYEALLRNSKA